MIKPNKEWFQFTKFKRADMTTEVEYDHQVFGSDESERIDKGKEKTMRLPQEKLHRLLREGVLLDTFAMLARQDVTVCAVTAIDVSGLNKKEESRGFSIRGIIEQGETLQSMKVKTEFIKFKENFPWMGKVVEVCDEINEEIYAFLFEGAEGDMQTAVDDVIAEEVEEEIED